MRNLLISITIGLISSKSYGDTTEKTKIEDLILTRKLVSEALNAYEKKDYLAAENKFRAAQKACAKNEKCFYKLYYSIGQLYRAQNKISEARDALAQFICNVPTIDWTIEQIKNQPKTLAALGLTDEGCLCVSSPSPNVSRYTVDDFTERALPSAPLWLPAGTHRVTTSAGVEEVRLAVGTATHLTLLDTVTALSVPPTPQVVPPIATPYPPRRAWGMALAGGAGLLLSLGAVGLGATAFAVDGQCMDDRCARRYDGTVLGPVAFGVGIAFLATGSGLLIMGIRRSMSKPPSPTQAGVALTTQVVTAQVNE